MARGKKGTACRNRFFLGHMSAMSTEKALLSRWLAAYAVCVRYLCNPFAVPGRAGVHRKIKKENYNVSKKRLQILVLYRFPGFIR